MPDAEVRSGIDLVVCGRKQDVLRLASGEGMRLKEALETYKDRLSAQAAGTVEVAVAPRSSYAGKALRDINFQDRFHVTPLSVYRQEET